MISREHHDPLSDWVSGVADCTPTILGYWGIGFAAGVIGVGSGFSVTDVTLIAAFLYAGAAQLLFYSMSKAGAGIAAVVVAVAMVNMRYLLMSAYIAPHLRDQSAGQRLVAGILLTDETFGLAAYRASRGKPLTFAWLFGVNLTAYGNWISANLAGALAGQWVSASMMTAFSFSLTAMFVALVVLAYHASSNRTAELVGIIVSCSLAFVLVHVTNQNFGVLLAAVLASGVPYAMLNRRGS